MWWQASWNRGESTRRLKIVSNTKAVWGFHTSAEPFIVGTSRNEQLSRNCWTKGIRQRPNVRDSKLMVKVTPVRDRHADPTAGQIEIKLGQVRSCREDLWWSWYSHLEGVAPSSVSYLSVATWVFESVEYFHLFVGIGWHHIMFMNDKERRLIPHLGQGNDFRNRITYFGGNDFGGSVKQKWVRVSVGHNKVITEEGCGVPVSSANNLQTRCVKGPVWLQNFSDRVHCGHNIITSLKSFVIRIGCWADWCEKLAEFRKSCN